MAKVTISRIFELSRALSTDAGRQLTDVLQFVADLGEQTLRNLRNGLTYTSNFDVETKAVGLRTAVATQVSIVGKKAISEVRVRRFLDTRYGLESWIWYIDSTGSLTVKATFTGSPPANFEVPLEIIIFFG